jgi:hypothetical protein
MKGNFPKHLALALALLTIIAVGACAKPEPAKFEVTELIISPDVVMPNDEVTVTATVDNTGGTEDAYTTILTMDGQEVERKDVLIGSGATKTAVFELTSPETDGDYTLSVGEANAKLQVFSWVARTIQYDNLTISGGLPPTATTFWTSWGGYGYLSHFEIPGISFRIKSINICGYIAGWDVGGLEERSFTLRIWDNKLSQELYSADYPYNLFPVRTRTRLLDWVKVEIPDLRVNNDFYVEVVTNAEPIPGGDEVKCGLYVCLHSSVIHELGGEIRVTEGNADLILNGVVQPWNTRMGNKETAAWTVRVEGESGEGD